MDALRRPRAMYILVTGLVAMALCAGLWSSFIAQYVRRDGPWHHNEDEPGGMQVVGGGPVFGAARTNTPAGGEISPAGGEISPAGDASTGGGGNARESCVYICRDSSPKIEVLLHKTDTGWYCGAVNARQGEGFKEAALRWIMKKYKLGRLAVETTHIIRREHGGERSRVAIGVVVRQAKFQWNDEEDTSTILMPVDRLITSPIELNPAMAADLVSLYSFLLPWVKTSGMDPKSACSGLRNKLQGMQGNARKNAERELANLEKQILGN